MSNPKSKPTGRVGVGWSAWLGIVLSRVRIKCLLLIDQIKDSSNAKISPKLLHLDRCKQPIQRSLKMWREGDGISSLRNQVLNSKLLHVAEEVIGA